MELLHVAHARVPAQSYAALWLAVARELDDEFCGLDSRRMKMGSFALLCHAVLHRNNLERAIRRYPRGFALFVDDVSGELSLENHEAGVALTNRIGQPTRRQFADETFIVMLHGVMCWLVGRRIPLQRVEFAHSEHKQLPDYRVMFTHHLRFDAQRTRIIFDVSHLAAPIVQTQASLKQFLRSAPQLVFLKYKNVDSWTARVRRRLRCCLGSGAWPTFEELAHEFGLAPSTQRPDSRPKGLAIRR